MISCGFTAPAPKAAYKCAGYGAVKRRNKVFAEEPFFDFRESITLKRRETMDVP